MNQITNGFRAVLSHPSVYDFFQTVMGAKKGRRDFADDFVKAKRGDRILDIGCGTAQILPYLPDGVVYHGYDVSLEYIRAAQKEFAGRGVFTCKQLEIKDIKNLPAFDIVLLIGVLHHLDAETATDILALTKEALRAGGRMISIDPCYDPSEGAIARYIVSKDRGCHVLAPEGYREMVRPHFARVDGQVRHRAWIPYTHWIMECEA